MESSGFYISLIINDIFHKDRLHHFTQIELHFKFSRIKYHYATIVQSCLWKDSSTIKIEIFEVDIAITRFYLIR